MHVRDLVRTPGLQVVEQSPHLLHLVYPPSTGGQDVSLHNPDSWLGPRGSQFSPPCLGAGLLHFRFLTRVPLPQVTEHLVHCPHSE